MRLKSLKVRHGQRPVEQGMRRVFVLMFLAIGYYLASYGGHSALADHAPQLYFAGEARAAPYDDPVHPPPKGQHYAPERPYYPDHPDDIDPYFSNYGVLIILIAVLAFWLGYIAGRGSVPPPMPSQQMVIDAINRAFNDTLTSARAVLSGSTFNEVSPVVTLARQNVERAVNALNWPPPPPP